MCVKRKNETVVCLLTWCMMVLASVIHVHTFFDFFFVSVKIVRATRERLSVPKKDKPTSSSSSSSKKKKAGGWEKKS